MKTRWDPGVSTCGDCTSRWPPDQPEYFRELFGRGSPRSSTRGPPHIRVASDSSVQQRPREGRGDYLPLLQFSAHDDAPARNPYRISPGVERATRFVEPLPFPD